LARALPGLEVPAAPTRHHVEAAVEVLRGLVRDFPWRADADFARWLCLLLTACCRHLIDRTPLGLIVANQAGPGQTLLTRIISLVAHGLSDPVLMSWPEGSKLQSRGDEIRKRLANLLHLGASLAVVDNLPRGSAFSSAELDGFLTSDS